MCVDYCACKLKFVNKTDEFVIKTDEQDYDKSDGKQTV